MFAKFVVNWEHSGSTFVVLWETSGNALGAHISLHSGFTLVSIAVFSPFSLCFHFKKLFLSKFNVQPPLKIVLCDTARFQFGAKVSLCFTSKFKTKSDNKRRVAPRPKCQSEGVRRGPGNGCGQLASIRASQNTLS